MWLACATDEEIAAEVGLKKSQIQALAPVLAELPKPEQVPVLFADADFTPPLFNLWTFAKKTEEGRSGGGNSVKRGERQ